MSRRPCSNRGGGGSPAPIQEPGGLVAVSPVVRRDTFPGLTATDNPPTAPFQDAPTTSRPPDPQLMFSIARVRAGGPCTASAAT